MRRPSKAQRASRKYSVKINSKIRQRPKRVNWKRINMKQLKEKSIYPFKKNYFDLVISVTTLHNLEVFDLEKALKEIERVGKKKYILKRYISISTTYYAALQKIL